MKKLLQVALALSSVSTFAYGIGYSTHPMSEDQKLISTELTGITSDDGGLGLQVRYTQKINKVLSVDAGLGIGGGDREQRFFVGADYEIFPDYMQQPRFSLKTNIERAEEFGSSFTVITAAPTISKGFNFWGKEAFPYASIPFGLSLNSDTQTYDTVTSMNVGINGQLPIDGYKNVNGNLELQVGLQESFTAVIVGMSFPMN